MSKKAKMNDPVGLEMGRRVKKERLARDWTQRQLAEATGWNPDKDDGVQKGVLSPSRIGNFEQGTRRIRHEEAEILSRVFGRAAPYYLAAVDEREAAVLEVMRQNAA